MKIWSQIPFSGTTMVAFENCSEKLFFQEHGFEINELPYLIDLAKDYGKVQFFLSKKPTLYEGLKERYM